MELDFDQGRINDMIWYFVKSDAMSWGQLRPYFIEKNGWDEIRWDEFKLDWIRLDQRISDDIKWDRMGLKQMR